MRCQAWSKNVAPCLRPAVPESFDIFCAAHWAFVPPEFKDLLAIQFGAVRPEDRKRGEALRSMMLALRLIFEREFSEEFHHRDLNAEQRASFGLKPHETWSKFGL